MVVLSAVVLVVIAWIGGVFDLASSSSEAEVPSVAATLPGEPEPLPTADEPPTRVVDTRQEVPAFHPSFIKVFKMNGGSEEVLVSSAIDKAVLEVVDNGYGEGTVLPRELPGVLNFPAWRSLPGTGTGTTEIDGHAQVYPEMVFTPLMRLPEGKPPYSVDYYMVELKGDQGQVLRYRIQEVIELTKGDIESHPELNEDTPDRLLLYTCQVENGQPIVEDRVVVATLVSSKAGL